MPLKQGASRVAPSGARRKEPKANKRTAPRRETEANKGAVIQRTGMGDRWQAYLAHHKASAADSFRRLLASPVQSLMTALVMAIALALPATLLVSLNNVQQLGAAWDSGPRVTLFLNSAARQAAIDKLQNQLEAELVVASVMYISAEQALADFERESGMGSALRSLDKNPLPPALVVTPQPLVSVAQLQQLADKVQQSALVEDVLYDQAWIKRLYQILHIGERLVMGLGGLLIAGVLLVIGNTIRLAIENRRDEIVIIKLVGGTDAFVRRPFLYTGLWYGLAGGILAWLLLTLGLAGLSGPVTELASLYQSDFRLQGLGFGDSLGLLCLASLVGWLGAWLTVGRQLNQINPE